MIDKKEILARLANGEDAQNIANELAGVLNDAITEHVKEQEAAKTNKDKENALGAIMTSILDFLEKYYPDIYDDDLRDFENSELLTMVDAAVEDARKLSKAVQGLDKFFADLEKTTTPNYNCKCEKKKDIDPIEEFINKYVN